MLYVTTHTNSYIPPFIYSNMVITNGTTYIAQFREPALFWQYLRRSLALMMC